MFVLSLLFDCCGNCYVAVMLCVALNFCVYECWSWIFRMFVVCAIGMENDECLYLLRQITKVKRME